MKRMYCLMVAIVCAIASISQTNPSPQNLPFNFSSQSGSTLPAGMAVHRFGTTTATIPTTRTTSPGNADLPYNSGSTTGGWRDEAANGLSMLASGSNAAGALIVSINTLGQTNIQVSWIVRTILQQASRDNSIALQYRVGTSGNFTDVGASSTFSSTGTTAGASSSYTETLPPAAENQPEVQVRWIYWESTSTSGSRDRLAVDDISITATNTADVTPPAIASLSPANGATDIPVSTTATINFSEGVTKGTGNITVKRTSDNSIVQSINVASSAVTVSSASASFNLTGLSTTTGYYIEIDNGAFKDLSGNPFPGISGNSTWSFTTGNVFYIANFQNCSSAISDGFTQFSVTGSITWACTTFGRDPSAPAGTAPFPNGVQINGFAGGTNVPNVDWLISPSFDLTGTAYPLLSFWSRTTFNGLPLQLKVSTDYVSGDPRLATWTDVNGKFPLQTSNIWTLSSNINLSAFKAANVHFAFVYTSTDEDGARWTLDDVSLTNSATPPPASLTTSTTDIQFTFVASGSTAVKTFNFTGNDLTDGVTINSTGAFQLSRDGVAFSPSISYTVDEANNVNETVYVRFAPTQKNQDYSGTITVSTADLSNTINLKGTSIDPATTLEIVNWNIEWFGSTVNGPTNDNQQEQNVKTVLQNVGADIYGLLEVVDEARLANIVSQMPGYTYVIGNYGSHVNPPDPAGGPLSEAQKLAFVYKTSLFSNVTVRPLINNQNTSSTSYNNWSSGRYPLLMTADVTLNCVTKRINFILVHAKANTSPTATAYARRQASAVELHDTIQTYFADQNVIMLGDFNDDLDRTITSGINPPVTSYSSFTSDTINFFSPTLALSLAGKKSTVSFNDVIDHVMLSNEIAPYYMSSTANILTDVSSLVSNYGSTTTDHYPVFTRYKFEAPAAPVVTSCPVAPKFCKNVTDTYTVPAFTATSVCGTVDYSYVITGATSRSGNTNDASGHFDLGTSTITWYAVDAAGDTASCQTTVVVNGNPVVTIPDAHALPSGTLANTVYIGYTPASSITLGSVVTGGSPGYTYSWSTGASSASATVAPTVNTTYTLSVTDANGCQGTATRAVAVLDIRAGKKLDKVSICHTAGIDHTIEIAPSAVPSHLAHGDMLGSCEAIDPILTNLFQWLHEVLADLDIKVLPNPSPNSFTLVISGGNTSETITIRVSDINGRIIDIKNNLSSNRSITIGDAYQPGIYFVEITQGAVHKQIKLVKLGN
jgi:hypothetical protein